MKLLAISEHYFPCPAGTVSYVHHTLTALVERGVEVELWVPGPEPTVWLPEGMAVPSYKVVWIDVGHTATSDISRSARYYFCDCVNDAAQRLADQDHAPDVLHVVYGPFIMERLDTDTLRSNGLPSVVTVHTVPPKEYRRLPPQAPYWQRLMEQLRLQGVGWKNRRRLQAYRYDGLIVPSAQVRDALAPVLPGQSVEVISHGPSDELLALMHRPDSRRPMPHEPLRILTVGGYVPHKRQHLIPEIAKRLRAQHMTIQWDVIGPTERSRVYYDSVVAGVEGQRVEDIVHLHGTLSLAELAKFYDGAHLYVQPSTEEGFCITALDAAAAGLPVIASPAGALASIATVSNGALVDSTPAALTQAMAGFIREARWGDPHQQADTVRTTFSWSGAAQKLKRLYETVPRDCAP